MNSVKKMGALVLAAVLAVSVMTGCNGGGNTGGGAGSAASSTAAAKEIKATDYVLAFHKYICTGDEKAAADVKMHSDTISKLKEARSQMDNIDQIITQSFDAKTLSMLNKESVNEFVSAFTSLLSRVEATATEESSNGDTVKVKITSDTIDFQSMLSATFTGILSGVNLNGGEAELKQLMDKMMITFADACYNYKFTEKQSATVELKKSGDTWEFASLDKDGGAVLGTIIKMDN